MLDGARRWEVRHEGECRLPAHRYIDPLDPANLEHPPTGEDGIHEIEFDGYRAQAHKGGGRVTVFSRKGYK
jgi:bifunctional non-homologous end joining protein LigD